MLGQWFNRYCKTASNSKRSSQLGAFLILMIALIEAFDLIRRASAAENLSWESVINGAVPISLFILTFGLRFILLFSSASNLVVRAITWWLIVLAVCFCYEVYGPEPGVVYDLFHTFPLEVSGSIFLFVGAIRFLYFASVSFKNDVDPHS